MEPEGIEGPSFEQAFYTSTTVGLSGKSGWQFAAASPGLDQAALDDLTPYLGFERPGSFGRPGGVDVVDLPVSLTHQLTHAGRHVLVCARHAAPDEFGRLNHFAHALVPSSPLPYPIELWRAPGWAGEPNGQLQLAVVRLASSNRADRERLLAPLLEPHRRGATSFVLEAGLRAASGDRRLVIVDDDAGTAAWIALVSFLLSPTSSAELTFATFARSTQAAGASIVGTLEAADIDVPAYDRQTKVRVLDLGQLDVGDLSPRPLALDVGRALAEGRLDRVLDFNEAVRMIRDPGPNWSPEGAFAVWAGSGEILGDVPASAALGAAAAAMRNGVQLYPTFDVIATEFGPRCSPAELVETAWAIFAAAPPTMSAQADEVAQWLVANAPDGAAAPTTPSRDLGPRFAADFTAQLEAANDLGEVTRMLFVGAALAVPLPPLPKQVAHQIASDFSANPSHARLVADLASNSANHPIAGQIVDAVVREVAADRLSPIEASPLVASAHTADLLKPLAATGELAFAARLVTAAGQVRLRRADPVTAVAGALELANTPADVDRCFSAVMDLDETVEISAVHSLLRATPDRVIDFPPQFCTQLAVVLAKRCGLDRSKQRNEIVSMLARIANKGQIVVPVAIEAESLAEQFRSGEKPNSLESIARALESEPRGSPANTYFTTTLTSVALAGAGRASQSAYLALSKTEPPSDGVLAAATDVLGKASDPVLARAFESLADAPSVCAAHRDAILAGPFLAAARDRDPEHIEPHLRPAFREAWADWTAENIRVPLARKLAGRLRRDRRDDDAR